MSTAPEDRSSASGYAIMLRDKLTDAVEKGKPVTVTWQTVKEIIRLLTLVAESRASLSERGAPKNWRDNAKIMEEFRAIRLDLTMSDENDLAHLLDAVLQLGDAAPPRDTEN